MYLFPGGKCGNCLHHLDDCYGIRSECPYCGITFKNIGNLYYESR